MSQTELGSHRHPCKGRTCPAKLPVKKNTPEQAPCKTGVPIYLLDSVVRQAVPLRTKLRLGTVFHGGDPPHSSHPKSHLILWLNLTFPTAVAGVGPFRELSAFAPLRTPLLVQPSCTYGNGSVVFSYGSEFCLDSSSLGFFFFFFFSSLFLFYRKVPLADICALLLPPPKEAWLSYSCPCFC